MGKGTDRGGIPLAGKLDHRRHGVSRSLVWLEGQRGVSLGYGSFTTRSVRLDCAESVLRELDLQHLADPYLRSVSEQGTMVAELNNRLDNGMHAKLAGIVATLCS